MKEHRRIVLANEPRLLREMLQRVVDKQPDLQVVSEVSDWAELPSTIERTEAQWVILPLLADGKMPAIVDSLLSTSPTLHILAVAMDGSRIKMKCGASEEEWLNNLSLDALIALLRRRLHLETVLLNVEKAH